METVTTVSDRKVRTIPASKNPSGYRLSSLRPKRVAAYCRVSTDREQQEHSFETQKQMYTDMIMMKPSWQMAGIYSDEGITGTAAKKRPGFMKMIEDCRKGKIDVIITKSVSRFSRNNLECLTYVRELKEKGIAVIFEKEGINTLQVSSELMLSLFGGLSQAESESISMNVKMGIRHNLKNGKVNLCYKSFLGYRKGEDGNPEIVPEEAKIIRRIFNEYLLGKSLNVIAQGLIDDGILTPRGKEKWTGGGVLSILKNEKYKGDALLQKTYIVDCISKKTKKNTGELPMYYVENSHPAIIEREIFDKVQEEIARRNSKKKTREKGTKSETGKYSGKYALSELVYCGECGKPYRRITWNIRGKKKIVWRCVSRLDYGKKYCQCSPSIEETVLQNAVAEAVTQKAHQKGNPAEQLLTHIEMYRNARNNDGVQAKKNRLEELQKEFDRLTDIDIEQADTGMFDERFENLMTEIRTLEEEISETEAGESKIEEEKEELSAVINVIKNRPVEYNDCVMRQLIAYIRVVSSTLLQVYFKDGTMLETKL